MLKKRLRLVLRRLQGVRGRSLQGGGPSPATAKPEEDLDCVRLPQGSSPLMPVASDDLSPRPKALNS